MIKIELKPLFSRLNDYCRRSLEDAAGLALSRGHYEISIEHLLSKLLDDPHADAALIVNQLDIDVGRLRAQVDAQINALRTGNGGRPVFSPLLAEWVQDAWVVASVTLDQPVIRGAALLIALRLAGRSYGAGARYAETLGALREEALLEAFDACAGLSIETLSSAASTDGADGKSSAAHSGGSSAIARFCEDFTAKAAAGKIDPVFGRDREIRQMLDILARRRKNNPILVGDPGVGKTAVVEGLAMRIVEGDVPEFLANVRLLGLDMGLLEAGASVKGEFENRLRGVIDEVKASTTPIVLFIDEAHMLVGAGAQAGGGDAANLLKPALARGELRTIAATTWAEYKKYFEKDPALARRFQLVKLDQPDVPTSVQILRGLKDRYEAAHGVAIRDDALIAAAELSARYVTGRQLPDKAVDLLDTAAARVKIGLGVKPFHMEELERGLLGLERERVALTRDAAHGHGEHAQRLDELAVERAAKEAELAALRERWAAEQSAARRVFDARAALARHDAQVVDAPASGAGSSSQATAPAQHEAQGKQVDREGAEAGDVSVPAPLLSVPSDESRLRLSAELAAAQAALADTQQGAPLLFTDVSPDAVARVVSDWTGVPLGKLQRDRASMSLSLADALRQRIRGQDWALETIASMLKSSSSGLRDPEQPLGVFLLVGPSGVGKTESAMAVADHMFGGEQALVTINMSEFLERHSVSRLVGSPPGYVGYGEGGVLTEAIRQRPFSVVLLDEVEKAHLDVVNLFYQVFDKGTLNDGEGREIDFRNTVVFLTSNLASAEISSIIASEGDSPVDMETLVERIRPVLSQHFKPALLARMTIVPYRTLAASALGGIVKLKLARIAARLLASSGVELLVDDAVADEIAQRCTEVETGARNVDFILRKHLMPRMSDLLLEAMADGRTLKFINVCTDGQGGWNVTGGEATEELAGLDPVQTEGVAAHG
ncbi:type VI secretion system ATPase TssH [Burkholderia sp. WSM2232]|uniref:type VI secretion system ATPase TssH n=1 Tax=Burkholderia sp. WSM2232 TaxID=944436 RepID=UPI0004111F32|nr:type VI secretion system ATPase TssH [Burkholderia sp. WSM2232]